MSQSKHYSGEAVDARVVDVLDMIATKVKARLESLRPRTFDTALELTPTRCPNCGKSLKGSHIHVEHDPK